MSGPERCVNPDWYSGIADKVAKEMAGPDTPAPAAKGKERLVTEAIDRRYQELESYYFGNQLGVVMNGVTVMLCTSCGALCGNTRRHALWHEGMRGGRA